jgi:uncharacterized protein
MLMKYRRKLMLIILCLCGLGLGLDIMVRFSTNRLWFQEVGFSSVFWQRVGVQSILGVWGTGITVLAIGVNLLVARRKSWTVESSGVMASRGSLLLAPEDPLGDRAAIPGGGRTNLPGLIAIAIALAGGLSLLFVQYGYPLADLWGDRYSGLMSYFSLPLKLVSILQSWQGGAIVLLVMGGILLRPRSSLNLLTLGFALGCGDLWADSWLRLFPAFAPTPFNWNDPLFDRDLSFYIFTLPALEVLDLWLLGIVLWMLLTTTITYVLGDRWLSQGKFLGFSPQQTRHLAVLIACLWLVLAYHGWLEGFHLLYSPRGVSYGASYTDVHVHLPIVKLLSLLAVGLSIRAIIPALNPNRYRWMQWRVLGLYLAISAIGTTIFPDTVQRLIVRPNEIERETPFIQRSIKFTRRAFNLDRIDTQNFDPSGTLTAASLKTNDLTIKNIRLWDASPLLAANRQLQQIRPYYRFAGADIDRYTIDNIQQQAIVSARELDYDAVPKQAQTWVNKHLVYTHGYGFTMSPVNRSAPGGLPDYLVKDIESPNSPGKLIGDGISTKNPRLYYGEMTKNYIFTPSPVPEFDYPSGNSNVYNTYDGQGGVLIGKSWWRRLLYTWYFRDPQILLTRNFTPQTKILYRRSIGERVRTIAPWLRYDVDPYLVSTTISSNSQDYVSDRHLYWLIDGYTTSDRYPYADPGDRPFNYIRNSVKVTIDAYDGRVRFYISDPEDPAIVTWSHLFPDLFQPLSQLPPELRRHLRYPVDLFRIQSDRLRTYHMTDAQVFYNREDLWQVPKEIYDGKSQAVAPYYLIAELANTTNAEFILLLPFTPTQRTNLVAWLAARSDGEQYGKLLLYEFSKQQLIYGPEQVEALINQDPAISQQISLWNRQGSRAIQGNLLVIPIEKSLLYVEPLYLEAEQNSLPTLVRVIVAYRDRIVMEPTLSQALQKMFPNVSPLN